MPAWQPATLGVGSAYSGDGHEDRRCEDGLTYENGDIPLIAVERGGELDALVMAYAVHGTVLTIDDLTLSQDVSGGIEQAVADRFDREVLVTMFNSWGGDMAPGSPELTLQEGAERPENRPADPRPEPPLRDLPRADLHRHAVLRRDVAHLRPHALHHPRHKMLAE